MVNIKIEKFAKTYVEHNKGENLDDVIKRLKETFSNLSEGASSFTRKNVECPIKFQWQALVY